MKDDVRQEVIDYFAKNHGPVESKAQIEIVPSTWPPISIHAILPGDDRNYMTLFTTGMSDQAMTVPEGNESFRFAELFIQVPPDWPFDFMHRETSWIILWLRQVAGYFHASESWTGGAFTFFANDDPPKPLADHVKFTTWLMIAKENMVASDGRIVQLYHVTPIYTEERDLEIRNGLAALMRAFDREKVSFVVDLNRQPATQLTPWYGTALYSVGCLAIVAVPILLLLWIWFSGMGWASLASFLIGVLIIIPIHVYTDW